MNTKTAEEKVEQAPRCNQYGDFPDGRHVMEVENEFLNAAELKIKRIALKEAHEEFSQ